MGHITSQEALMLRWTELCNDPLVRDLPGRVELNGMGVIEMSPATTRHGRRQVQIGSALETQMGGAAFVECPILTGDGIRAPDVAWASPAFMARYGSLALFQVAPEICVEVRSPSNTDAEMEHKTALYLAAGAREVWIVAEGGGCEVHTAAGPQPATAFPVTLPAPDMP